MRVALLSNVTVDVLAGMLGRGAPVWTPPGFGAWMETALEPPESLRAFGPELICILIDRKFGTFDPQVQDLALARDRLRTAFPGAAVIVPDVERLAADFGDAFYDEKMWKLGKMPFSIRGLRELKKLLLPKKVLAIDLDNTLWKGVIGEDGVEGIEPNVELMRQIKALKDRGVLLTVLSKNDEREGLGGLGGLEGLAMEDFAAWRIDWNEKPNNLAAVAKKLNLGVDSFVFVDDNPAERAQMRARLPEVTVADFPPQLDVFFPERTVTDEDMRKTELYRAEAARRDFAAGMSAADYLRELDIRTDIRPATRDEVPRLAQLSQKTNQFNVCTNRYSEREIAALVDDPDRLLVSVRSRDRFGDYGLIAFVLARLDGEEAEIVDWVMSCRTMNRRIEFAVEAEVERLLSAKGVRTLRAKWRRTAKNVPVADLFAKLGFAETASDENVRSYEKSLKRWPSSCPADVSGRRTQSCCFLI